MKDKIKNLKEEISKILNYFFAEIKRFLDFCREVALKRDKSKI